MLLATLVPRGSEAHALRLSKSHDFTGKISRNPTRYDFGKHLYPVVHEPESTYICLMFPASCSVKSIVICSLQCTTHNSNPFTMDNAKKIVPQVIQQIAQEAMEMKTNSANLFWLGSLCRPERELCVMYLRMSACHHSGRLRVRERELF
jgi:hypothetical protein